MTRRAVARVADTAGARPWLPVEVDGDPFVLAALDGRWFAVEDRCAHAGCPFSSEASLEGSTIVCNCHGSEFELTTGELRRGPAEHGVRAVPARVAGDAIELDL